MSEFFHSQAFAFILGCFTGGMVIFIVTIILAASSRDSKAEGKTDMVSRLEKKAEDIFGMKI